MPSEFGRKWGTECLNTRIPLHTLLCAKYSVKLILISRLFTACLNVGNHKTRLKTFNDDVPFFILTLHKIYDRSARAGIACLIILKMCQSFYKLLSFSCVRPSTVALWPLFFSIVYFFKSLLKCLGDKRF